MVPKLPRTTAAKVERVLLRHGYTVVRQSGIHRILRNVENVRVTLPMHAGKTLHPKILRQIIRDTGIPEAEFS